MTTRSETPIAIEALTAAAIAPYGWMLGKGMSAGQDVASHASAASDFWHEHDFDAGTGGKPEILWVTYRSVDPAIGRLEAHSLTQQAVIPLTGSIVQILAAPSAGGTPDLATVRAFAISPGHGICMRPGIWHATRSDGGPATCLMLTRHSTTADLVQHLNRDMPVVESRFSDTPGLHLSR